MPDQTLISALNGDDQAAMQPETYVNPLAKNLVQHTVSGLLNLPQRALEASAADMSTLGDHSVPKQSVEPATDAAMKLIGNGLPWAQAGSAGIFGGKLAQGADLKAMEEAQQMAAKGVHPDLVLKDTGWHRNPADHQWRFEIPDTKSALNYMPEKVGDTAASSMQSLFHHPDLYKAYPELGNINLRVSRTEARPDLKRGGAAGEFWRPKADAPTLINAAAPTMNGARSAILHELQHGVQTIEGFSPGSNPSTFARWIEAKMPPGAYDYNKVQDQAMDMYRKTAGEVEARNVQTRADRASNLGLNPWYTQDTPFIQQSHYDPVMGTLTALKDKR